MQVLACLMLGKTNREIGKDLSISESTVKAHVTSLFEKLKVSTRLKAGVVAWETFPMLRVLVRQRPPRLVRGGVGPHSARSFDHGSGTPDAFPYGRMVSAPARSRRAER